MLARFFIDRPVLAWVISVVIVLLGGIAAALLPGWCWPSASSWTTRSRFLLRSAALHFRRKVSCLVLLTTGRDARLPCPLTNWPVCKPGDHLGTIRASF